MTRYYKSIQKGQKYCVLFVDTLALDQIFAIYKYSFYNLRNIYRILKFLTIESYENYCQCPRWF